MSKNENPKYFCAKSDAFPSLTDPEGFNCFLIIFVTINDVITKIIKDLSQHKDLNSEPAEDNFII